MKGPKAAKARGEAGNEAKQDGKARVVSLDSI